MTYATGNKAWGLCMRCSDKHFLKDLRVEPQTTLLVCDECLDQPIIRPFQTKQPRIALRRTSPNIPELTPLFADPEWPDVGLP